MPTLQTPRLELIPFTSNLIKLLVSDRAAFAAQLAVQLPTDWPGANLDQLFRTAEWVEQQDLSRADWGGHLAILKDGRVVIGYIGFKGPPDGEGTIEVGYSIAESYWGQGLASEAVQAMIEWAFRQPQVLQVKAVCDADNYPSRRVLVKLGMQLVAQEGEMLHWAILKVLR